MLKNLYFKRLLLKLNFSFFVKKKKREKNFAQYNINVGNMVVITGYQ